MSEEEDPMVSGLELHEEFLQRIENGGRKIKTLSLITIFVAAVLAVTYASQLVVLPFMLGVTSQTVNLVDPSLMGVELGVLALTLAWLYVGLVDYRYTKTLVKQAQEIRAAEAELMKKYGLRS
ncbi:MAG: hypothetical protein LYZ69_02290 [Nitrososphaerales archaeon]|nr:hypothetical protein [Nitrososphaerales archaeon]